MPYSARERMPAVGSAPRRGNPETNDTLDRSALRVSRAAWTALAGIALLVLYWLATSHRVYNHTLPQALLERVLGEDDADAARVALRKLYSIAGFALAGFVADKALGPGRNRALRAAIVVAVLSALIEIGQKLHHAREGVLSNVIDIACGALGGWLAVAIPRMLRARRAASRGTRAR